MAKRILVVCKNGVDVQRHQQTLEGMGYEVVGVSSLNDLNHADKVDGAIVEDIRVGRKVSPLLDGWYTILCSVGLADSRGLPLNQDRARAAGFEYIDKTDLMHEKGLERYKGCCLGVFGEP